MSVTMFPPAKQNKTYANKYEYIISMQVNSKYTLSFNQNINPQCELKTSLLCS